MAIKSDFNKEAQDFKIKKATKMIDSTLLNVNASKEAVTELCEVALKNEFATVCVFPDQVKDCAKFFKKAYADEPKPMVGETPKHHVKVCAVVGFPYGSNLLDIKLKEAKLAIKDGADEIDFVINQTAVKRGKWKEVKKEAVKMVKTCKNRIVKAILEVYNLNDEELSDCVKVCVEAGVKFIKSSTGVFQATTVEQIENMAKYAVGKIEVKASGGIDNASKFVQFIEAGASRIGTSHAKEITEQLITEPEFLGLDASIAAEAKIAREKETQKVKDTKDIKASSPAKVEEAVEEIDEPIFEEEETAIDAE